MHPYGSRQGAVGALIEVCDRCAMEVKKLGAGGGMEGVSSEFDAIRVRVGRMA